MSNDIAIRVENLGKMFRLGELERYTTLRDTLQRSVTRGVRRLFGKSGRNGSADDNGAPRREKNTIWALKDVSFEVKHGEVLGIIGRNGAGKSTLLKILSRITEPTTGYAEIRGRVGSLLEVGTGFHPELTGRENVYLNGSILGMSQREIRKKFDDIVSFAGVEKFIDTPVKRYSSGMQVRLAFAVAAHLDPEILIIDEVLAVGDAEFQKRCLGKMDEVANSGRTILFVSHNMAAVEGLCSRAMLLDAGRKHKLGSTNSVLSAYLDSTRNLSPEQFSSPGSAISSARILGQNGDSISAIYQGDDLSFCITLCPPHPIHNARLAIRIYTATGQRVLTCHTEYHYPHRIDVTDRQDLLCTIHDCRLTPGTYTVELQLDDRNTVYFRKDHAFRFDVHPSDLYKTNKQLPVHTAIWHPDITWCLTTP
ncbi:ABC transporter ATP-binding protein [Thermostilla marina]